MHPRQAAVPSRPPAEMGDQRLGEQLKCYFDSLTAGPVPDRLMRLTEALEKAFERGELCVGRRGGQS